MKTKQCSKCKEDKKLKYFSFRKDTQKYRGQCRNCAKGYIGLRGDLQDEIKALFDKGKKKCNDCEKVFTLNKFSKDKYTRYGYTSSCNKCRNKKMLEYRTSEEGKLAIKKRIHSPEGKIKRSTYQKTDKVVAKRRIMQQTEEYKAKKKAYTQSVEGKAKRVAAQKRRIENDPIAREIRNIRSAISRTFIRSPFKKDSSTADILGCNYEQWIDFIGEIPDGHHRDHIIPISLAETKEEIIILNHYSNFQVLSEDENRSKSNRFIKYENLIKVLELHPQANKLEQLVLNSGIEVIYE
jgi:hypothetical protein